MSDALQEPVKVAVEEAKQEVVAASRPWYYLGRAARLFFLFYALLLALFAFLAWWAHTTPVSSIDVMITREFQENSAPWLRTLMLLVSYPGNLSSIPFFDKFSSLRGLSRRVEPQRGPCDGTFPLRLTPPLTTVSWKPRQSSERETLDDGRQAHRHELYAFASRFLCASEAPWREQLIRLG